jgi:hypothetical protein
MLTFRAVSLERHAKSALQGLGPELDDPDLERLTAYLWETLRPMPVSQLVSDGDAASEVQRYLAEVVAYVRPESEIGAESPTEAPPPPTERSKRVDELVHQVRSTETWNALAHMRRDLELRIKNALAADGVTIPKMSSVSRLLPIAVETGLLTTQDASRLHFASTIASRAIHGEDVMPGVAEDAIVNAYYVLDRLTQEQ